MVHGIHPDELVRLAPRLRPYLRRPNPTWPDLIDAADWLRHNLGVSKPLWGDACLAMGRELAAVALAIVSTKEVEHFSWAWVRPALMRAARRFAPKTLRESSRIGSSRGPPDGWFAILPHPKVF